MPAALASGVPGRSWPRRPQAAKFWRCAQPVCRRQDRARLRPRAEGTGPRRVQVGRRHLGLRVPAGRRPLPAAGRQTHRPGLRHPPRQPAARHRSKRQALARGRRASPSRPRDLGPARRRQLPRPPLYAVRQSSTPSSRRRRPAASASSTGPRGRSTCIFASHIKQVWKNTKDQPLRATCGEMAARSFGAAAREKMGEYLERWVTDAPEVRPRNPRPLHRPAIDRYPAGPCRLPRAAEAHRSRRCLAAHSRAASSA